MRLLDAEVGQAGIGGAAVGGGVDAHGQRMPDQNDLHATTLAAP
jgi:hypothetical protein